MVSRSQHPSVHPPLEGVVPDTCTDETSYGLLETPYQMGGVRPLTCIYVPIGLKGTSVPEVL
jgi:hypothetical protein